MIIKRYIKYIISLFFHYSGFNLWYIKKHKLHYILMFHRLEDSVDSLNISIPIRFLKSIIQWSDSLGELCGLDDLLKAKSQSTRFSLTFDDGFENIIQVKSLLPSTPIILYLATDYIESDRKFWALELEYLIINSDQPYLDLSDFNLGRYDFINENSKYLAISKLNNELKGFHPNDIDLIIRKLRNNISMLYKEEFNNMFLSWEQVNSLIEGGMEIGGHTHSHVISSKVSPDEFKYELQISNGLIKSHTGITPKHFAYPNGRQQDIALSSRDQLKEEGYISAVTTVEGANEVGDDPFLLKRFNVTKDRVSNPFGLPSKAMFTMMLVNPFRFF